MTPVLYHYVHCPFCIRVRMTLGFLNLPYESQVVAYDDEETPVKLIGKKMLPILKHAQGAMGESLDIMEFLDKENKLQISQARSNASFGKFETYLSQLGSSVHSLAMPYWMFTPEFSPEARKYFQKKKEEKRGPFKDLVKNQASFIRPLMSEFESLQKDLGPYYQSSVFGLSDILLAAQLWGLYVVPEFQFPEKIHAYLEEVKKKCHFNYHQDFWR